jgi:hypothetical protein
MTRARNISKILSAQETTGNVNLSGVVTATSFSGEASGLTGLAAVGAGVTILRDGSTIGAATKINFDDTFTVTDISSGISTITGASGVTTADVSTSSLVVAGISTLQNVTAGVATANQFSGPLTGVAVTLTGAMSAATLSVTGQSTLSNLNVSSGIASVAGQTNLANLNITGVCTATSFSGDGSSLTGVGTADVSTSTLNVVGFSTLNAVRIGDGGDSNTNNIFLGADDDLKMYHTGTHAFVENSTGNVYLRSSTGTSINIEPAAGASGIIANAGSDVELYHNANKKLETAADGVYVTGIVTASTHVDSGITTYYGDSSYSAALRWTLAASGTDHYVFTGPGLGHSTQNDPTLYLKRGQTYMFENKMGAHPFRIQSTVNGSTGTQWNVGVTNNDVSNGVLIFEVPFATPDTLYYQCTSHANMGGVINIA